MPGRIVVAVLGMSIVAPATINASDRFGQWSAGCRLAYLRHRHPRFLRNMNEPCAREVIRLFVEALAQAQAELINREKSLVGPLRNYSGGQIEKAMPIQKKGSHPPPLD
jgi:hypothetical protein